MWTPLHIWLATTALSVLAMPYVWAQNTPRVKINASHAIQTDSNLFRLPAAANTTALIGRSSAAEQIGITSLGINFNTTKSLQKFELDASLVNYNYQNFSHLNFSARNYNAAWRWALTPRLTGTFASDLKETLNSFADYQGYNGNQRADTNTRFDVLYELVSPWFLLGGVSQSKQVNQQAVVAGGDYSSTSADLGFRHVFSSGSAISYVAKAANGNYLNRVVPSVGFYDDSFKQIDNALRLQWILNGNSTANIHLTHVNRTHPNYSQRDFSGFNTGFNIDWAITGKSVLGASYTHELGSYATATSNYSLTDRITWGPVWHISPKTQLGLRHTWAQIDYLGSPNAIANSPRRDITRDTSLTLSWQPYQQLAINASLQSKTRGSSQTGLDYDSSIATLSAQLSY